MRIPPKTWLLVTALGLSVACGESGGAGKEPATPEAVDRPAGPGDPLAGATVFDALGNGHTCELPKQSCPNVEQAPRELKDQCALKGYRVVQCGCAQYCTGNAMADVLHYDASNTGKPCAKQREDCTPPDTSAAFQDACSEAGHRFVVCGCEWLCSGKLKGPVPAKPPAEDEPGSATDAP